MKLSVDDLSLIMRALRQALSRSAFRRKLIDQTIIPGYHDASRRRVKTWCLCPICLKPTPRSYVQLDHLSPVIEITKTLEDYTPHELLDRIWCAISNLQPTCKQCHHEKSVRENKERRLFKKGKKK